MSDKVISKVKINNIEYNIKDAELRKVLEILFEKSEEAQNNSIHKNEQK